MPRAKIVRFLHHLTSGAGNQCLLGVFQVADPVTPYYGGGAEGRLCRRVGQEVL